ncbi:RHS repeat protein [Kosakonia sacchari]|uniref:RHS repeat protein n=1 Tax=Kosakonia sacchari TaxID=1158459 RepID=UPI0025B24252|nr:RHS repeat domain-containing protein [Kosakonia sacchari]MDN2484179.1 RHS repeat protein [Kosakonia sacchari]
MNISLFSKTPTVMVLDYRGLTVREMAYHRHPDSPDLTDERIIRHQFDARGLPSQSADPRLAAAGLVNFAFISDLGGAPLRTQSADAGTTVVLNDAAGRIFLQVSNIGAGNDRSAAVTRTFQYEDAGLPGRPLSVTGQGKISERFVWAGNSADEQTHNLAGQLVGHYDPAGLLSTNSISLSGVPLSVTRQLLPDDAEADWQGADASAWNDLLADESYTTTRTVDSAGNVLTTTDAKGNLQRVAYDVAGLLKGSWLTMNGGSEQVIVKSLTWSAAGQKLREEHGNGVVTTYSYEVETQQLVGIKTERLSASKVLQDLRYEYDPVGNVLVITNDAEETRFWRNQEVVPDNRYAYDSLYQLVSATGREMANAAQQSNNLPDFTSFDNATYTNYSRTYTYDNAGNLTKIQHSAPASGNNYTTTMTVSDRSNRAVLSTFTENPADVDALFTAGGQQKQLLPGQNLNWTPRQELQQVTPVTRNGEPDDSESYRYDAASQRIVKITSQLTGSTTQTKRVIYLPGLELRSSAAEELQVITVGEAGRAQVRVLHWESGQPDGISNDQVRYSYDNLTGSSSLEVDGSGELISQEEYYPYGGTALFAARSQLEADYKTIRYSGKEQDATGLCSYGYRYYQPWVGRWLSADPAGGIDGINLFRMVRNNPLKFMDYSGLSPTPSKKEAKLLKKVNKVYSHMATGEFWGGAFKDYPTFQQIASQNLVSIKAQNVDVSPQSAEFVEKFQKLDFNLLHYSNVNFLERGNTASFYSRKELFRQQDEDDTDYYSDYDDSPHENTKPEDLHYLATDDFAFFSLQVSGSKGKSSSRFGNIKYSFSISELGEGKYGPYAHVAMNDTLNYAKRELPHTSKRAQKLFPDFADFKELNKEVLAKSASETVFNIEEFKEGLAYRIVNSAKKLSVAAQSKIFGAHTPDEFDELLSVLFRPQVLVPRKIWVENVTMN